MKMAVGGNHKVYRHFPEDNGCIILTTRGQSQMQTLNTKNKPQKEMNNRLLALYLLFPE